MMNKSNPLMSKDVFGLNFNFGDLKASDYREAFDYWLPKALAEHEELCAVVNPTYDDIFNRFQAMSYLSMSRKLLGSMVGLLGEDELSALMAEYTPKFAELGAKVGLDRRVYDLYVNYSKTKEFDEILTIDREILLDHISCLKKGGIDLSEDKKAELMGLNKESSLLTQKFAQNLSDYKKALGFEVTEEEMAGASDRMKLSAKALAEARGLSGYWLSHSSGLYDDALSSLDNREIRERIYKEVRGVGMSKGFSNVKVSERLHELKQVKAKLLGYKNYSEMALEDNMATDAGEVLSFLGRMGEKVLPKAKGEREMLVAYAKGLGIEKYRGWDASYVMKKYRLEKLSYDSEAIREYFPVERTIDRVLSWVGDLLEVEFVRDGGAGVWAEGVRRYEVKEYGEVVASFYLDPYMRDGKNGGAWVSGMVTRDEVVDGLKRPVAVLVCNAVKGCGVESTFELDDVVTLFHELGHLVHFCLTKVERDYFAGFNNVAWDTIEFPSQMFENFVYDYGVLSGVSGKLGGGEVLPLEVFERVVEEKNFLAASGLVGYTRMAEMDMVLYSQDGEGGYKTPLEVERVVREKWSTSKSIDRRAYTMPRFAHIFSGGYSANYYSYKWAEVMSMHGLEKFKGAFGDKEALREVARSYKEEVLSKGGWRGMGENFEAWVGRKPDEKYLLEAYGLGDLVDEGRKPKMK